MLFFITFQVEFKSLGNVYRATCYLIKREEGPHRTHLDLHNRGHVDMRRVAERNLVGCRRFRARRKHPQDLQLAWRWDLTREIALRQRLASPENHFKHSNSSLYT